MRITISKYCLFFFAFLILGCGEMPVNWSPTFDSKDTIPYGTYVLRQELGHIFPDSNITNIDQNTYEFFEKIQYQSRGDHYIFIYPEDHFTDATWEKILDYVSNGGSALISNPIKNPTFEKHLSIKIDRLSPPGAQENAASLSILTTDKEKNYVFEKGIGASYFSEFNTETTDVLGYVTYKGVQKPNFIKVYYGDGYFLLHAEPYVFTNYHMLKKNHYKYVTNVFSYFEDADILWDNHRIFQREKLPETDGGFFNTLSFLMKHKALRWAFFLLLLMGILFLAFNSKRKQKAIPVILPYPNYTLDFAKTLSELYRYNSDHTAMVKYKINYFLEQIKIRYGIMAKDTEKDFSELLNAKSGVDLALCQKLTLTIDIFRGKNYLDKEDFFKLQSLIETFNQKSNQYGRTVTRK